jgi:hypothetical protein
VVTLDELLDAGDRQRDRTRSAGLVIGGYARVGLWSFGWSLAKLVTLILSLLAGVFFGLGWVCARCVPVLRWARTAFLLGWEAGRASSGPPGGGRVAA